MTEAPVSTPKATNDSKMESQRCFSQQQEVDDQYRPPDSGGKFYLSILAIS